MRSRRCFKRLNIFVEAFHSTIKVIHLVLEVKTSFINSTPVTGSSMKYNTYKPRLLLTAVIGITAKKRKRTCTQKVTKQSLSDYAQQDLPIVTK
jgi:hypothetical protein